MDGTVARFTQSLGAIQARNQDRIHPTDAWTGKNETHCRHNAAMNLATRLQHRPLLHALVQVGRRDAPPIVALRNTAAIVLPLAVGGFAGHLDAALGISVGAFNAMFADQSGPYRLRLQHMLLTALVAALAAFSGAFFAHWPIVLLLVVVMWSFAAGMLVAVDPQAARAGLISMVVLLVLSGNPQSPLQAMQTALLIFAGGVLQTLFAIAAWPLQRYRPERLAVAHAMRTLAATARQPLTSDRPVSLPPSLNDLQSMLFSDGRARGRAVEAFRVLAELAERLRIELHAVGDLQATRASAPLATALQSVRSSAAQVLEALAAALEQAAPSRVEAALAAYATTSVPLEQNVARSANGSALASVAAAHAAALGGQLRAASRNVDRAGSRGEIRARQIELSLPLALRPAAAIPTLRTNLRVSAPVFRHALRLAVCVAVAMGVSKLLPFANGYWLPMTVALVLRVNFGATWTFGLLRAAGTLGGLLFITAILHFLPGGFWPALALMAILCFAFRELAAIQYGVAVVFLTGLAVVLLSFYGVQADAALDARAVYTVLGSALALIAYLAWPTWERGRERQVLARMLDAYRDYLFSVLRGDARTRRETRVAARAARSDAEASLERLRTEPASRAYLPRAEAMIAQANRIVRAAMVLEAARGDATALSNEGLAFTRLCNEALTEAARAVCERRPPAQSFDVRDAQRALAESLPETVGAADAALLDASDRITDAIDSLLHVLAEPCAPA